MTSLDDLPCKCAFHNIKDAFHGIISERNHTNIRKTYRIISSLGQRPGLMDDAIHHADPGRFFTKEWNTMKIAICDDEKRIRDMLSDAVREVSPDVEIESFADAGPVLAKSYDADILFLDIQMPGIDGMKAARIIRGIGKKTVIVFVTALEEQVFNAFDVGAFQYIVKPFDHKRIKEVIRKAISQAEEQKLIEKTIAEKENDTTRFITVKSGGVNTRVIIAEIVYAEIFDRRIVLHMENRDTIEFYGRISELENLLGNDFFRVHRAYLINLAFVRSYDSKTVNVHGEEISVARGKYQDLIKAYLSYSTRSMLPQ